MLQTLAWCSAKTGRSSMRSLLSTAAVLVAVVAVGAAPAAASCAPHAPEGSFQRAEVVLVGVALDGRSVDGMLASPVAFDVLEYQKGEGPSTVKVAAGVISSDGEHFGVSSVGIYPAAGERWQVFGTFDGDVLQTSTCAGSRKLRLGQSGFAATPAASDVTAGGGATAAQLADTGMALNLLSVGAASFVLGVALVGMASRARGAPRA
jgi:hypothetical protein